jgi:hypothetical protein
MPLPDVKRLYAVGSAESHQYKNYLDLKGIDRKDISSKYRLFFDQTIVTAVDLGHLYRQTSYVYNNNAKVKHIIIGLQFKAHGIPKLSEKVDKAVKKLFTSAGYTYKLRTEWNSATWEIYQRPNSKYLVGFSNAYRSEWGDYNIIISVYE